MTTPLSQIRNFSIIAHIDHGKSTLADRLIQRTGGLTDREMSSQVLDNMDIEKERGITIKAQTVRLSYPAKDGVTYTLNLMDTPGHVDFAYEVSRSLAACEGALLVVDAAQGVEAQTLANVYQSIEHDHEIVPVINKIDLPAAEPEKVRKEIEDVIGLDASEAVLASAKSGIGIDDILDAIVTKIPPPKGDATAPLKAMLVNSWYDPYLGVVILVRVIDGTLKKGQQVAFMQAGTTHLVDRVGCFRPKIEQLTDLGPGEIGFITAQIKDVAQARVGDTLTDAKKPAAEPLPGFKEVQPVVFCGLFPVDANDFEKLRELISKLRLNDASFSFEMETSAALGFGFRCGFGAAAPGDHPGATDPRIRPRPDHDRAVGGLSDRPDAWWRPDRPAQPRRHARSQQDRVDQRTVDRGDDLRSRRISRQHPEAVPGPPRYPEEPDLCRAAPRRRTNCRSTKWCSTSTIA